MSDYFNLLKVWCDRLTELQIESTDPRINGGIICPACHFMHGRCGDAIYPLVAVADITGDNKYLEAAKKLFIWTENNMVREDGAVINDSMHHWKGISVFYATGLLEAILHHKSILDKETYELWSNRVREILDFLIPYIQKCGSAVNYSAAMCGALALAYIVFDNDEYLTHANKYAELVIPFIDGEGIIAGEPKANLTPTKKGCLPVDIGYNVEETLPALVNYYKITGNQKLFPLLLKALTAHMDFYLLDGGIDNSFGSRSAKWSYWGSRTSDGCQTAYLDMASFDPRFAEVARRNFKHLEKCTKDGLLHGGEMYIDCGEPPCVHHTFCHAKALAHIVDAGFTSGTALPLPMDMGNKVKRYSSIGVSLVRHGNFRATFSEYDWGDIVLNPYSTATMTLLQHDKAGTIFAATLPNYRIVEPMNMQLSVSGDSLCNTLRIEKTVDNVTYTNIFDRDCVMRELPRGVGCEISGYLRNENKEASSSFSSSFSFKDDKITAAFCTNDDATLVLPIVSSNKENFEIENNTIKIYRKSCVLKITADTEISIPKEKRNINMVGGFSTLTAYVSLKSNTPCKIKIAVE